MPEIDSKIAEANTRLRAASIKVSIERRGNKLWLRATLPPKPHINKHVQDACDLWTAIARSLPAGLGRFPNSAGTAGKDWRTLLIPTDWYKFHLRLAYGVANQLPESDAHIEPFGSHP